MAEPSVVVLLVLATAGSEPMHGTTIASALREGVGNDVRVLVEERHDTPSDEDMTTLAGKTHATALAEVRWTDPTETHAHVHFYVVEDGRWVDQELGFTAADRKEDRERAVGLLLGTMIRGSRSTEPPPPAPPAPPPNVPAGPSAPERPSTPEHPELSSRSGAQPFSAEVGVTASRDLPPGAHELGPAGRLQYELVTGFSLVAGGALRIGELEAAQARTMTLRLGGGGFWRAFTFGPSRAWSLGALTEVVVVHPWVTRETPPVTRGRWISGGLGIVRLDWQFTSRFSAFLGGGAEVLFGRTPIVVGGHTEGEIPPLRAVAEVGVTAHF